MGKCSTARQATKDNIIWCMRFACWTTKAKHPHSEYVILLSRGNAGYPNTSHCYIKGTLSVFLISNFRRVLNVVRFLLGNSPESEFYMLTFRNSVPKRQHIKFSRRGITQKKA